MSEVPARKIKKNSGKKNPSKNIISVEFAHLNTDLYFTLLFTGDEHSSLIPHSPAIDYHPNYDNATIGGFARLASKVNQIRREKNEKGEPVLLASAGDFIGGPAFSWLAMEGHAAELTIMQEIGYDAVTIGNHEFDFGTEILTGYLYAAGYPEAHEKTAVLTSSVASPENHPISNLALKGTHIITLSNGIKIGFFSILGDEALMVTVDTCPFRFRNQLETARKCVNELITLGADIIIALTHASDAEDAELARAVPGIHIIIGGHSHNLYDVPVISGKTIIAKAGAFVRHLGRLELGYNPQKKETYLCNESRGIPYLEIIDNHIKPDPHIVKMVDDYIRELDRYIIRLSGGRYKGVMNPVALSDFPLRHPHCGDETPLGNFLTDAMRLVVEKETGEKVDFAFQASGVIRNKIGPGTMDHSRGLITFYELTEAFGLGSGTQRRPGFPLASIYITGEEVRRILEISVLLREYLGNDYFLQVSGLRFTCDPGRAILFYIPYENLPVPTTRAVLRAEKYTGQGVQTDNDGDYLPLHRGDKKLYHVITDYAILEAIPHVADRLPWLSVEPKNSSGGLLENREEALIYVNGNELKVWEAVVEYATTFQKLSTGEDLPRINEYYQDVAGRVTIVKTVNLLLWPALFFGAAAGAAVCWSLFKPRPDRSDETK